MREGTLVYSNEACTQVGVASVKLRAGKAWSLGLAKTQLLTWLTTPLR